MPALPVPTSPCPALPVRDRRPATAALAAVILLVLTVVAPLGATARAVPPGAVSIHDATGTVDQDLLAEELTRVDFRTEVDLAVLVLDVTDHGYSASQDTALNDSVLDHARTSEPSLLSADGQHFAEGTVILALDPDHRFLGTYAGEDVKLDDGGFTAVQDAMREDAQDAQWEDAVVAGAEKYAGLLDRPWWQHPATIAVVAVGAVGAGSTVLVLLSRRAAARREMDEYLPAYRDVLAQRALTDASARTLPESSLYARAAAQDYAEYGAEIAEAERLHERLPDPAQRSWGWGLRRGQRELAADFSRVVRSLDDTDDALIAAADLLHRIGGWREAWERELAPLRDSLARMDEVLADDEQQTTSEQQAASELADLGRDIDTEMAELTVRLEEDRITPDSALERLDTLTRELSAAVTRLQEARIARLAEDESEAEVLREVSHGPVDGTYRSLRARRHRWDSAARPEDAFWSLSPVLWYSGWQHTSASALEEHRNPPAASGGSTSGFSAGGFSGAGSSSRF